LIAKANRAAAETSAAEILAAAETSVAAETLAVAIMAAVTKKQTPCTKPLVANVDPLAKYLSDHQVNDLYSVTTVSNGTEALHLDVHLMINPSDMVQTADRRQPHTKAQTNLPNNSKRLMPS
jgi:hypothetical protein